VGSIGAKWSNNGMRAARQEGLLGFVG